MKNYKEFAKIKTNKYYKFEKRFVVYSNRINFWGLAHNKHNIYTKYSSYTYLWAYKRNYD